jgi:hypothetical protein
MVDSNGRVTELEDDAMLPPLGATAGVAPDMAGRQPVDAAPLNGPGSGYASRK